MPSIDAFLALAEFPTQAPSAPRASLRRVRADGQTAHRANAPDPDRVIANVVGIVLVAAVFYALHAAMQAGSIEAFVPDTPILISILRLPQPIAPHPLSLTPKDVSRSPARTPPVAVSERRGIKDTHFSGAVIPPQCSQLSAHPATL